MKNFAKKIGQSTRLALFINFFKSSEMSLSSIAVAYYLLLALFPILLIIANALPYLHINVDEIQSFLQQHLPEQLYQLTTPIVHSILAQPNTGLLSFSVIIALWTFSRAISALQMAINKAYEVNNHRDFILSRLFGILTGFLLMIFLYFAVGLATFGQQILAQLHRNFHMNDAVYRSLHNITLPVVTLTVFIALALLYFILPNVKIKKIRYVMPGTIFSVFVLVILTNFIGNYITESVRNLQDFKLVGTLAVFALMIWFIFIARVLILGAIFNATYQKHREGQIETRRGEIIELIRARNNDNKKDISPSD